MDNHASYFIPQNHKAHKTISKILRLFFSKKGMNSLWHTLIKKKCIFFLQGSNIAYFLSIAPIYQPHISMLTRITCNSRTSAFKSNTISEFFIRKCNVQRQYLQKQALSSIFREIFMFITKISVKESMHEKQSMSCNHLDKIIEDAKPFRILTTVNINKWSNLWCSKRNMFIPHNNLQLLPPNPVWLWPVIVIFLHNLKKQRFQIYEKTKQQ